MLFIDSSSSSLIHFGQSSSFFLSWHQHQIIIFSKCLSILHDRVNLDTFSRINSLRSCTDILDKYLWFLSVKHIYQTHQFSCIPCHPSVFSTMQSMSQRTFIVSWTEVPFVKLKKGNQIKTRLMMFIVSLLFACSCLMNCICDTCPVSVMRSSIFAETFYPYCCFSSRHDSWSRMPF